MPPVVALLDHPNAEVRAQAALALGRHGLDVVDVEELATHGGSLRLHVAHRGAAIARDRVHAMLRRERAAGGLARPVDIDSVCLGNRGELLLGGRVNGRE